MKKQITGLLLTLLGTTVVLELPKPSRTADAQTPARFRYEHNFNDMVFYAADGVTLNQAYGEHVIQDACGRTWHMSMGQRFSGEAYLGWNNVQARAELSTSIVQQRFPNLLDYSAGRYYSSLSTNFETEKITKIRFEYLTAYAVKPVWIAISVQGGPWQIVLSANTTTTSGFLEYVPTQTITSARVALIQNFNSYSNSNGRIKTTNVVMEVA